MEDRHKLNGDTYVGSTDGTNPAHTVWTVASDNTVNSGYPVFGDLKTDTAVATIDPDVTTMAGVASAELTSALGTSVSLGASSEVLAAPTWESSDTAATEPTLRSATTEVSDKFSSWGTTNADANVALSLGEWDTTSMGLAGSPVVLTSGLAAGDTLATTDASAAGVALNVAAAYGRADTLTYQVLLASGKKCYSTTITVKPATRRTISADTKVDAELFELSPDGTVKSAEAKRSSKVQNQGAAPVAGSVTSIEPLVKDSVISGDFNGDSIPESVTITDELVPTAEGTTLLDSNESVSRAEGGMVKLGVKAKDTATGADADKKTNIGGLWTGLPTELPLYFVPGSDSTAGTVPLAFSLPGTTDADAPSVLSYLYFMDYTGTYVLPAGATAGSFGYRMAYELSIPAGDVDAATASKTTP